MLATSTGTMKSNQVPLAMLRSPMAPRRYHRHHPQGQVDAGGEQRHDHTRPYVFPQSVTAFHGNSNARQSVGVGGCSVSRF